MKERNLLILPIIYSKHWTLLKVRLNKKIWKFYDSLPNPQHKQICEQVISLSIIICYLFS
ncbi:hypothetical protein MA16_Dca013136 [Dendrobium catenatum]|uniref:Ubiquitin-like protease family profile domain-containing protein n=1 Tax=Dendrobium catenatum TaxID=906689 RepID=A0A2I0WD79_9ASPA|nr:hypothetical protein MA16_Dca013136 [Dendrobium catenatum]